MLSQPPLLTLSHLPTSHPSSNSVSGRVAALEVALASLRELPRGIGHNRGPSDFAPPLVSDLAEVDRLIALLKEQTPNTVIKREELIQAARISQKLVRKIGEYSDEFFKSLSKTAGSEAVKAIKWFALGYALQQTLVAVHDWLQGNPGLAPAPRCATPAIISRACPPCPPHNLIGRQPSGPPA